jgi:hypothetical protein
MDENPYQSPKSLPEGEEPSKEPPNRYFEATLAGSTAWALFGMSLYVICEMLLAALGVNVLSRPAPAVLVMLSAVAASPVGVAIAWWTWHVPRSKWPAVVNMLLLASVVLVFVILCVAF